MEDAAVSKFCVDHHRITDPRILDSLDFDCVIIICISHINDIMRCLLEIYDAMRSLLQILEMDYFTDATMLIFIINTSLAQSYIIQMSYGKEVDIVNC